MSRRLPPAVVAGLCLALVLWVAVAAANGVGSPGRASGYQVPEARATLTAEPSGAAGPPPAVQPPPSRTTSLVVHVLGLAAGALLLAVVLVVLVWALRRAYERWWRARAAPALSSDEAAADPRLDRAQLAGELHRSAAGLQAGQDFSGTVVACWHRLEDLAAASGSPREPWQSTTEYVVAVLGGSPAVSPGVGDAVSQGVPGSTEEALRELAEIYRTACYSTHQPGEQERARAVDCLARLAATFDAQRVVPR